MVALYVLETAAVDELWIVPAFQHPFGKALAPFDDRLAMCELAAAALGPRVRVSGDRARAGGREPHAPHGAPRCSGTSPPTPSRW